MSRAIAVIAALSFLACPSQEDSAQPVAKPQKDIFQEMVVQPENFYLGQDVEVTGALIRPTRNSAKFICKELRLPDSGPPVAGSTCVAVSGYRKAGRRTQHSHALRRPMGMKKRPDTVPGHCAMFNRSVHAGNASGETCLVVQLVIAQRRLSVHCGRRCLQPRPTCRWLARPAVERGPQPLTTPTGRSRATTFESPAISHDLTTSEASL